MTARTGSRVRLLRMTGVVPLLSIGWETELIVMYGLLMIRPMTSSYGSAGAFSVQCAYRVWSARRFTVVELVIWVPPLAEVYQPAKV